MLFIRQIPDAVDQLAFSPDGTCLASAGGLSGAVRIWDPNAGEPLEVLQPRVQSPVGGFVWSRGGSILATAYSLRSEVYLWAFGQPNPIVHFVQNRFHSENTLAFSPDWETLAVAFVETHSDEEEDVSGVRFWDITGPRLDPPELQFSSRSLPLSIAFTPDGTELLAICEEGDRHQDPPYLTVRSFSMMTRAQSEKSAWILEHSVSQGEIATGQRRLLLSPDHSRLALIERQLSTVSLWHPHGVGTDALTSIDHASPIAAMGFSPDNRTLATAGADGTVKFWSVLDGHEIQTFDWAIGPVHSVAFATDGLRAACGGQTDIVIWDVDI
jgi:WD40 repeat protein